MPSLRERREYIGLLADYFLRQLNARFDRNTPPIPEEILESLENREWRGNIRELENLVARYAILGSLDAATTDRAPRSGAWSPRRITADGTIPLKHIAKQAVREMEGTLILAALGQRWRLCLEPGHRVETHARITLRPKHGMRMIAERR